MMTWGEFKELVDERVEDGAALDMIDISAAVGDDIEIVGEDDTGIHISNWRPRIGRPAGRVTPEPLSRTELTDRLKGRNSSDQIRDRDFLISQVEWSESQPQNLATE